MKNIAIIGAGELGSRHLQALALSKEKLNIYVIDPQKSSLERSKTRFNEKDHFENKNLFLGDLTLALPPNLDFSIIATTSKPRLDALKYLFNQSKVKYLLLEKFLFPELDDYKIAQKLINKNNAKTYVNCTRRLFPIYQEIKKNISGNSPIRLVVNGVQWNLASNSIHFLDLFSFIASTNGIRINTEKMDKALLENKRKGHVEFSGTLSATTSNGHEMHLTSLRSGIIPTEIFIEADKYKYKINEFTNEIVLFSNGNIIRKEKFHLYKQSELTHKILESLIEKNECDLVEFDQSAQHHMMLLNAFNEFFGCRVGVIT